ncbi:hypothetical protein [Cryptosporangium phraense]|uniref:Hemophore-related protein n=1 Tax=Cryptosporangium phraense TaxID=2593070 RepID=A0A545AHV3_9ACTN|nr:hypothetical protein [Cryptosporangium phraense]TQS40903.1 hypothetical protein FL583_32260 [Cryptosporangium phraense]
MSRRWIVLVGLALVSACGTADPAPTAGSPSQSAAASGDQLCGHLEQIEPQVAAATSPSDARTIVSIQVATIASSNPGLRDAIATQLDTLTTKSCPQTRQAILAKVGADSFADVVKE